MLSIRTGARLASSSTPGVVTVNSGARSVTDATSSPVAYAGLAKVTSKKPRRLSVSVPWIAPSDGSPSSAVIDSRKNVCVSARFPTSEAGDAGHRGLERARTEGDVDVAGAEVAGEVVAPRARRPEAGRRGRAEQRRGAHARAGERELRLGVRDRRGHELTGGRRRQDHVEPADVRRGDAADGEVDRGRVGRAVGDGGVGEAVAAGREVDRDGAAGVRAARPVAEEPRVPGPAQQQRRLAGVELQAGQCRAARALERELGRLVVDGREVQRLAGRGGDADVEVAAAVEVLRAGGGLVARIAERAGRAEHRERLVGAVARRARVGLPLGAVEVDRDGPGPERGGEEVAVHAVADGHDLARRVEREARDGGARERELVAGVEDRVGVDAPGERGRRGAGLAPGGRRVEADVDVGAVVGRVEVLVGDRRGRGGAAAREAVREEREDDVVEPVVRRGVAVGEGAREEVAVGRRAELHRALGGIEGDRARDRGRRARTRASGRSPTARRRRRRT